MKSVKFILLALVISVTSVQKSHAAVALLTLNGPLALYGLATPFVANGVGQFLDGDSDMGLATFFLTMIGLGTGVIMLDSDEDRVEFLELDAKAAQKMGVTELEREVFNLELDEANMILAEVSVNINEDMTFQDVKDVWTEYSEFVSPETFSAIKKIAKNK